MKSRIRYVLPYLFAAVLLAGFQVWALVESWPGCFPAARSVELPHGLPEPVKHRKYAKRASVNAPSPAPPPALLPAPGREGPMAAKVRELLKRRPMTSGEVIKALPESSPQNVYALLGAWRKTGITEMIENPDGLGKKNKLVTS